MKSFVPCRGENAKRRADLDWLRVLATLVVLLFHSARYFDLEGWHVKNPVRSTGMMVFVSFLVQWMMPLFFIISAMISAIVLGRRPTWRYLRDRAARVLVPFLVGTFIVLIPVQVWIERVTNGQFDRGFWAFYPHYFDGWYGFGGNFAWMGLHLWYLQFLFVFSLLTAPLFRLILSSPRFTQRLAGLCNRPGGIFLLVLPVLGSELLVNLWPDGIGMRSFGGWSLLTYLFFFITGFVMAADHGFRAACERFRWIALIGGLLTVVPQVSWAWTDTAFFSNYFLRFIWRSVNSWLWLIAIFGFAGRHLVRPRPFLSYANEGVLPFYALHQTIIVVLGFWMLKWTVGIPIKFAVLVSASFVAIMACYHFAIRPWNPVRVLFGMRRQKTGLPT